MSDGEDKCHIRINHSVDNENLCSSIILVQKLPSTIRQNKISGMSSD